MKIGDLFVITQGPQRILENGIYYYTQEHEGKIFKLLGECGNMWAVEEVHVDFGTPTKLSINKNTIKTETITQEYLDLFTTKASTNNALGN